MLVDAAKVKTIITERWSDEDLRPLLLFKGSLREGRARHCLNFTRAMMAAEIPNATELAKLSVANNDVAHLSGLHAKTGWTRIGMQGFFYRTLESPTILERVTGLRDYIHWVTENTPHFELYELESLAEFDRRSSRLWRRPVKTERKPLAEYYPFISQAPTEDHELLLAVDRLVPKYLLNETRADVCQDMLVAVLTGEVTLENLRDAVPKYIKQFIRQSPSRYNHLSLETPHGNSNDGGRVKTIGEMIV